MTVQNTSTKTRANGNGSLTAFSFNFKVFADTDLEVYIIDADGVEAIQTLNVDYTVAINAVSEGGTVTMSVAPAVGEEIFIRRILAFTQPTDIPAVGSLREEQVENEFDRLCMLVQQLKEQLDRALTLPITDSDGGLTFPAPSPGKYIKWNVAGTGFENTEGFIGPPGVDGADGQLEFDGFGHGLAADFAHDIYIEPGQCMDEDNENQLILESTIVKRIDAVWASGDGSGGLDTGTIGASACPVAMWVIGDTADVLPVDVIFTKDLANGPSMPAGYDFKRQIGSLYWTGSAWALFRVRGRGRNKRLSFSTPRAIFGGSNLASTTPFTVDCSSFVDPAVVTELRISTIATVVGDILYARPVGFGESGGVFNQVAGGGYSDAISDKPMGVFDIEINSDAEFEAWVSTGSYKLYLQSFLLSL